MLNSPDCYTLGHSSPLGDHSLCLDTASSLPPFMPLGQDEQQMFVSSIFSCCPLSFVLYVPCGVPIQREHYEQVEFGGKWPLKTSDLIIPSISSPTLRSENGDTMKAIGEGLEMLAGLPTQEFKRRLGLVVEQHFEQNAFRWQPPQPLRKRQPSLCKIVDQWVDTRIQMIRGGGLFNVSDLEGSLEDKLIVVQESFLRFGGLLRSWADIIEISAEA